MENSTKEVYFNRFCPRCAHKNASETDFPCCECLEEPVNEYSHKPTRYVESILDCGSFSSLKKVKDYLYEVSYKDIDYENAYSYFQRTKNDPIRPSGCSAIRNGNYLGRNFDWTYDNLAEFVVHIPRIRNKFASVGISGGFQELTKDYVESGVKNDIYKIVPFQLRDGINEHGLAAEMNVVPNDYGNNVSRPKYGARYSVSYLMLIRFILDNFRTAFEAVDYISKHVEVYFDNKVHSRGYEVHYLIADTNETYLLEFVNDKAIYYDISNKPYITNFYNFGVNFNQVGTVYTPGTQDFIRNAMTFNFITKYGSGLERYNLIVNRYSGCNTKSGMRELLNDLAYTKAYLTSENPSDPYWYTEFVGSRGLTCASPVWEYTDVVDAAGQLFVRRSRNDGGKTWQTVHSSIYDISQKKLHLVTQEDGREMTFTI